MGYYTNYNLYVNNVNTKAEHQAIVEKLNELEVARYVFDDDYWSEDQKASFFFSIDPVEWYDHDEDMRKIAKAFPEKTFKLNGAREDDDDRWYCLYKGEDSEYIQAIITWPEPKRIKWKELWK